MTAEWNESLDRVDALRSQDGDDVVPACRTHLLSRGEPTDHAVVILHGFTNAPVQCRELAQAFFDQGANVLVPRIPFHGLVDPFSEEMSKLTPDVLTRFSDAVIDAAAGLGGRLRLIGLSLGGLIVAQAALNRDEVAEADLIAPFFQPASVPVWIDAPFDEAMKALPDHFNWWNSKLHQVEVAGTFAYPKFSLKAVAAQIHLRRHLEVGPSQRTSKLERVLLVLNDADVSVRGDIARTFVDELLAPVAEKIDIEVIEASFGFTHDLFEPNGENREKMDALRDRFWPVLGLRPPEHGSLDGPIPGGGYFADLGPWKDEPAPDDWPTYGARYTRSPDANPAG